MMPDRYGQPARPRSTPIPGIGDRPLTPTQSAARWSDVPTPPRPPQMPTPAAAHRSSPPPGWSVDPGLHGDATGVPAGFTFVPPRRGRGWMWLVVALTVLVPVGIAGYAGIRAFRAVNDAADTSPRLPGGAATLFDPAGSAPILAGFEQQLGGTPTAFTGLIVYPTYAIASAVDGNLQTGLIWQSGATRDWPSMAPPDAQTFTLADVAPEAIARAVAAVPATVGDPAASAAYVVVERWPFESSEPLRILVYVNGGGRYIEATAEGTVVATH